MRRLLIISILFFTTQAYAAAPQVVCVAKSGGVTVKPKCGSGESRLNLANLQAHSVFDTSQCQKVTITSNSQQMSASMNLACPNPNAQFLQSFGYVATDGDGNPTAVAISFQSLIFYGKAPSKVILGFVSLFNTDFTVVATGVCCPA